MDFASYAGFSILGKPGTRLTPIRAFLGRGDVKQIRLIDALRKLDGCAKSDPVMKIATSKQSTLSPKSSPSCGERAITVL
jgi:hypothetical protein